MLTEYLDQAMASATFRLDKNGYYAGQIPAFLGVWSTGPTLDESETRLRRILEEWVVVNLQNGNKLPVLGGIDLNAAATAYAYADAFA